MIIISAFSDENKHSLGAHNTPSIMHVVHLTTCEICLLHFSDSSWAQLDFCTFSHSIILMQACSISRLWSMKDQNPAVSPSRQLSGFWQEIRNPAPALHYVDDYIFVSRMINLSAFFLRVNDQEWDYNNNRPWISLLENSITLHIYQNGLTRK